LRPSYGLRELSFLSPFRGISTYRIRSGTRWVTAFIKTRSARSNRNMGKFFELRISQTLRRSGALTPLAAYARYCEINVSGDACSGDLLYPYAHAVARTCRGRGRTGEKGSRNLSFYAGGTLKEADPRASAQTWVRTWSWRGIGTSVLFEGEHSRLAFRTAPRWFEGPEHASRSSRCARCANSTKQRIEEPQPVSLVSTGIHETARKACAPRLKSSFPSERRPAL